ncbi:MAG: hypothetical protein AAFP98_11075 [Pseudomonadota bacterium]
MRALVPLFFVIIAFVLFAISIDAIEAGAFSDKDGDVSLSQTESPRLFWGTVTLCGFAALTLVLVALKRIAHVGRDEQDDTSS